MIFVSMDAEDLLSRTSRYRIRESESAPPSPTLGSWAHVDPDGVQHLVDAAEAERPRSRRADGETNRAIPPPISDSIVQASSTRDSIRTAENPFPLIDLGDDSTPPPQDTSRPSLPEGLVVTSSCDDPSDDEEEESSAATLADRYRRDRLPPPYDESENEDEEDVEDIHRWRRRRARELGLPHDYQRRPRRKMAPRAVEVVKLSADDDEFVAGNPPLPGVLPPHACFFIEKEKSVTSVKFDPPL